MRLDDLPAMKRRKAGYPRNDRLLRDAGLSAEQAFGPARVFWSEWKKRREPWLL
jgi:hypothetical protein